jgi:hypothetical protein
MAEQIEARIRRGGSIHGTQDTLDPEERKGGDTHAQTSHAAKYREPR